MKGSRQHSGNTRTKGLRRASGVSYQRDSADEFDSKVACSTRRRRNSPAERTIVRRVAIAGWATEEPIVQQNVWTMSDSSQQTGGLVKNLCSTVRIGRRPFYRGLATFAASCFVGTLATDIAYWWTAHMMWADFSDWLLTVGVIVGYVTVVVALIETFAIHSPAAAARLGGTRSETWWL